MIAASRLLWRLRRRRRQVSLTVSSRSMKRSPWSLPAPLRLRSCTAKRSARSGRLLVGSTPAFAVKLHLQPDGAGAKPLGACGGSLDGGRELLEDLCRNRRRSSSISDINAATHSSSAAFRALNWPSSPGPATLHNLAPYPPTPCDPLIRAAVVGYGRHRDRPLRRIKFLLSGYDLLAALPAGSASIFAGKSAVLQLVAAKPQVGLQCGSMHPAHDTADHSTHGTGAQTPPRHRGELARALNAF